MSRYTLTTGQKVIIGVGLALLVFRLLQAPALFNPLISFLGAGALPGTNRTLSPDAVLKLILAIFISAIALIVLRLAIGRRRQHASPPRPKRSVLSLPTMRLPHFTLPHIHLTMPSFVPRVARWSRWMGLRMWAVLVVLLIEAWQRAEPSLRRFDAWLARVLNGNEITGTMLEYGRKAVGFAKVVWHRAEERLPHGR